MLYFGNRWMLKPVLLHLLKRRSCCSPFPDYEAGWPSWSTDTSSLSPHTPHWVPGEAHDRWKRTWFHITGKNTQRMRWNILLNWPTHSHNLFFCSLLFYKRLSKLSPAVTTSSPQAWTCLLTWTLLYSHRFLQTGVGSSEKSKTGCCFMSTERSSGTSSTNARQSQTLG